jgi:hypothetical protein
MIIATFSLPGNGLQDILPALGESLVVLSPPEFLSLADCG